MSEQRQSARKILKVKAVVALAGQAPMPGRTLDVGAMTQLARFLR